MAIESKTLGDRRNNRLEVFYDPQFQILLQGRGKIPREYSLLSMAFEILSSVSSKYIMFVE